VLTSDQVKSLTKLIESCDTHKELVMYDSPEVTFHRFTRTNELLEEVALHLKQLQLEVINLGQQLHDIRHGQGS
jgi:hypothetical protein